VRKHPSEDDRQIADFVRRAVRELEDAIRVATRSKHNRAAVVRRDLENALRILTNLTTVANRFAEPEEADVRPNPKRERAAKKSDNP
jgi:hypothetical protein